MPLHITIAPSWSWYSFARRSCDSNKQIHYDIGGLTTSRLISLTNTVKGGDLEIIIHLRIREVMRIHANKARQLKEPQKY